MSADRPSPQSVVFVSIALEGGLGVGALLVGNWLGRPPGQYIVWRAVDVLWGAAATLVPLAVLLLSLWVAAGPLAELTRIVRRMVRDLFRGCTTLDLAMVALAAGLGEELLFRGVIQPWAIERLGTVGGVALAAVLFGLVHPLSKTYVVFAGLMGAYLGWLMLQFDNLLVPIVTHALYDFAALWLLMPRKAILAEQKERAEKEEESEVS